MFSRNEEKALDPLETLHEAIRVYLETKGYDDGLLMEWVLITSQHKVVENGTATGIAITFSNELPLYRAAGLVKYGEVKICQNMMP